MPHFHLLPHQRPEHDSGETVSELRRVGELILAVTFSTLGDLIKARGDGSTNSHLLLLDVALLAILLSLASSALHLELQRPLRLSLARLFLSLEAFFTTAAVVLLISSSVSPSLRWWVPFAVFFSTFLFLVSFKLFPATLHYVAAVRRCRFAVLLIGPSADFVDVQSPSYQSSSASMPGQRCHGEIETPPLAEHRRVGEFILAVTFPTLGALIQARGDGSTNSHLLLLLDVALLAILLSLVSSALHLELHRQIYLSLARLFLSLEAFFTMAAVVLRITSFISPSLRWVPFAVSFSTFLFLVFFKLFPATFHCVAADVVDVQSPSYQSSSTSMPGQRCHGESVTPPLTELRLRISIPVRREQWQWHSFLTPSTDHIMLNIEALVRTLEIHTSSSD